MADTPNNKGRFRQMDIETLRESNSWPIWDEVITTKPGDYSLPLPSIPIVTESGKALTEGIPQGEIYRIGDFWCCQSPQSHIGPFRNAIDFLVADGTPVLVARSGVVVEMVLESDEWGDGPEFAERLNYITLRHSDGQFSQYCHLGKNSAPHGIRVGSHVKKFEVIATVAKTGWTDRDHLHFIVFQGHGNQFGFRSMKINW